MDLHFQEVSHLPVAERITLSFVSTLSRSLFLETMFDGDQGVLAFENDRPRS